jgi:hypothetical protein
MSVKLLGFAAVAEITDHTAFAAGIRSELISAKDLLGANMIVLSGARTETDLIFLRTCIELRIPTIVFLIDETHTEHSNLLGHLLSVSLAKYSITETQPHLHILEWADALLCACCDDENEILIDAMALGIPTRKFDTTGLEANWTHQPNTTSNPRHGFPTRRELLEFLDKRFGL